MKYGFKKLLADAFVFISNGFGFKKLKIDTEVIVIPSIDPGSFDLGIIGLPPGTYKVTVTAEAKGYEESEHSNVVTYTVERKH